VVVGSAAVSVPPEAGDASRLEPWELMAEASRAAAADAGAPALLGRAGLVVVPRGSWPHRDPGRLVADAVGAGTARTLVTDIGILQTTVLGRAASAVQAGHADVVLVTGAEARHRHRRLEASGLAPSYAESGSEPDEVMRPTGRIISEDEVRVGLVSAAAQYALIENARRGAAGSSIEDHGRQVAELWARFNAVAVSNPQAWFPRPMAADEIASAEGGNRWISFPYRKWEVSQWNVDQGAAFIVCSVETARALGVPVERWVFLHTLAESNHMIPVSERADVHRSPGFALAGRAGLEGAQVGVDDVALLDLYSCFPVAVSVQAAEMGIASERALTITGGMTFAGGPLNNYVLQSGAAMTRALREAPGELGMLTAVSGLLTKQGVLILGSRPAPGPFRAVDVSAEVARLPTVSVRADASGAAPVVTYTVVYERDEPARGVVLTELGRAGRALASTRDPETMSAMLAEEWIGRTVRLDGAGGFTA